LVRGRGRGEGKGSGGGGWGRGERSGGGGLVRRGRSIGWRVEEWRSICGRGEEQLLC